MPPKSGKLVREELRKDAQREKMEKELVEDIKSFMPGEVIEIKQVECLNDFVALLQVKVQSPLELPDADKFKSEGMVIGIGPGIVSNAGTRCPSQVKIGDMVSFYGNSPIVMKPSEGIYKGFKIIVMSERSLLMKLPPLPFKIVNE